MIQFLILSTFFPAIICFSDLIFHPEILFWLKLTLKVWSFWMKARKEGEEGAERGGAGLRAAPVTQRLMELTFSPPSCSLSAPNNGLVSNRLGGSENPGWGGWAGAGAGVAAGLGLGPFPVSPDYRTGRVLPSAPPPYSQSPKFWSGGSFPETRTEIEPELWGRWSSLREGLGRAVLPLTEESNPKVVPG